MNLKKFVQKLDSLVAGVFVEGPRNGAQRVVSDLQKDGPVWSGQYSNSWQIEGLGKVTRGDGQPGNPRKIKVPRVTGRGVGKRLLKRRNETVFTISNFSEQAPYAEDQLIGRFRRDPRWGLMPTASKGQEKMRGKNIANSGRRGEGLRYEIGGGNPNSVSSRTAKQDWIKISKSKAPKTVKIEISKAIKRSKFK